MQNWGAHSNAENLQSSISYTKPQHKPEDPGNATDPESGDGPDGTGPTVLDQCPWDDLQGAGDGTVGPLVNPRDGLGFLIQGLHRTPTLIMDSHFGHENCQWVSWHSQPRFQKAFTMPSHKHSQTGRQRAPLKTECSWKSEAAELSQSTNIKHKFTKTHNCQRQEAYTRDPVTSSKFPQTYLSHGHLRRSTTWAEVGVNHDIASNVHGVLQIALHLWQDVLAGPSQQDGACLGVLALHQECEVPAHTHTHTHTHSCQATQQQKKGKVPAHAHSALRLDCNILSSAQGQAMTMFSVNVKQAKCCIF